MLLKNITIIYRLVNKVKILSGSWEVFFSEEWGGPEKKLFPELISWTESEDDNIKFYSGMARYRKPFYHDINSTLIKDQRVFLDLGNLSKVAEVWLNDEPLGITWAKPYRFDITDKIKAGNNLLEVEIANVWANRIIGDALSDGKDYTYSNVKTTTIEGFGRQRFSWEETPLVESGLFGPVKIETIKLMD